MVEPLLSGIVLGLIFVTLAGLFFAAYQQYKRGDQLGINKQRDTQSLTEPVGGSGNWAWGMGDEAWGMGH